MHQVELLRVPEGFRVFDDFVQVNVPPFPGPGDGSVVADVGAFQEEHFGFSHRFVLQYELDLGVPGEGDGGQKGFVEQVVPFFFEFGDFLAGQVVYIWPVLAMEFKDLRWTIENLPVAYSRLCCEV